MKWAKIRIETTPEASEAVSALLEDQGCHGTAMAGQAPVHVIGYLPVDDLLEPRLLRIREGMNRIHDAGLPIEPGDVIVTTVEEEDWTTVWRQFYKPTRIGKRIVIKPSWEEFQPSPGDIIVELDPGMAFGSGAHPSTALCLRALEERVKPGDVVLDIGTGSGILAIAAAKLGASRVIAVDDDSVAVHVASENVEINGLQGIIDVRQSDGFEKVPEQGDIVLSNIVADVIIPLAPQVPDHLKPGGTWISAGIIDFRLPDVKAAVERAGFRVIEVMPEEEWVAVVAAR